MTEEKVICSHSKTCKEAYMCGGAKPHTLDENECGKCTFHKDARCNHVNNNQ
jgi:hypothetical protein